LAGRETCAALLALGERYGFATSFLSLNDSFEQSPVSFAGREIKLRGFARHKSSFVLSAIRAARSMPENFPQVILAFHPNLAPPALLAQFMAPEAKTAVVSHGVEVWQPLAPMRRRAIRRATISIGPSRFTCEALRTVQGVPRERIRLLPWSVSPSILALADSRTALPLPSEFPSGQIILSVGRWSAADRYKGADELIEATSQLVEEFSDIQVVMAGDGDDVPRLQALAKSLALNDHVHFLRGLSEEHIAACYSRADIFALPSTGEGFGLVFLEAMAFGKPVVATRAGGATDVVKDGESGLLVEPQNSQALAATLARLLRDPALRVRLGSFAATTVRRDFSFSSFTARLESYLRELGLFS